MSKRTAKARGSAAERELLHKLHDCGWAVVRAAGSGSTSVEAPDVIAGKKGMFLAIEIKYCSKERQYLRYEEIIDLIEFATRASCEAWIAVRYIRKGWTFVKAAELQSSGKNYVIVRGEHGISFEELLEKKEKIISSQTSS